MTTPEFSRPHRLDQIGTGESHVSVEANEQERAALARRFDLKALDVLRADYTLRRDAGGVVARGRLVADAVQSCVVTDAAIDAAIAQDFAIRFVPEGDSGAQDDIELSEGDCDIVFYDGAAIDLGEAAAETLALALDPYPRAPGAAAALRAAGVLSEEEARRAAQERGPFGALAGLQGKRDGD